MASARLTQSDTALVAPFTASVVQRNVELGMLAGPSQAAYTLADIGTVKAAFGVPDTVVVQLRPGRTIAVIGGSAAGQRFHGHGHGHRVRRGRRDAAVSGGSFAGEPAA